MFLPSWKNALIYFFLFVSSALIVLSVILIILIVPNLIQNEILKTVGLKNGSEQYDTFKELPFPVMFKVYIFNVENPIEIVDGKKPIVKEIGPYVYKEYRKKFIKEINLDDDTISYIQRQRFEFDREASGNLSENDLVTVLNLPLISILETAEKIGHANLIADCTNAILGDLNTIFIKVKVQDILFNGITFCAPRLSLCQVQKSIACKIAETKKNIDKMEDKSLRFSFFNYKVKTNDGNYTVNRGVKTVKKLGQIMKWNNLAYTNYWNKLGPQTQCDEIRGCDSTLYPPGISKLDAFEIYSTDICRSVELTFSGETVFKEIKGYTFSTNNSTLRSKMHDKEVDCFCSKETKGPDGKDSCFLDGVMDIQPCTGAPVLLSFPHFLWANDSYIKSIEGIFPNETLHKTFVTIEPDTGTPLQGSSRFQINAVARPIKNVKQTSKLPGVVLPLVWIDENFSLTDEYVNKLNSMYFDKVFIVNICKWCLLGTSTTLTIIFVSCIFFRRQKKTTSEM